MRNLLLICLGFPVCVFAQLGKPAAITLIDRIPLIAETGLYIDSLYNGNELYILSDHIRIAIAPRRMSIVAEHYFKLGKPLLEKDAHLLQYRIRVNNRPNDSWKNLQFKTKGTAFFPYDGELVDTVLTVGDRLLLEFSIKGRDKIIQQIVICRTAIAPMLSHYRHTKYADSLDTRMAAAMTRRYKQLKNAFDTLQSSIIKVKAGNGLQCLFKPVSLNTDSCLQYRLRQSDQNSDVWHTTGHLLSLPALSSNQNYMLDIRYAGNEKYITYSLLVLPYWYQTGQALLLFIIVLAVLLFFYYRYRKYLQSKARKQLLQQLNNLQVKLNPHFVYNALGSIEGLVYQKDHTKANYYLTAFSDILRSSLLHGQNLLIPLRQDIDLLEKYILLEQLRFGFKYNLTVHENLPVAEIEFPPMLLQPAVENAVKHGVALMQEKGVIDIVYGRSGNDLIITVSDNGTGKGSKAGTGLGKQLTIERIDRLSRFLKNGRIECSIQHGQLGTVVIFFFENWLIN